MKNKQLKERVFPNSYDMQHPIFTWQKTALIGDMFYAWWLYYGNAVGKDTLCHQIFYPMNKPLDQRARIGLAWSLRIARARVRREWRQRHQSADA
jgi:hypothetical protein